MGEATNAADYSPEEIKIHAFFHFSICESSLPEFCSVIWHWTIPLLLVLLRHLLPFACILDDQGSRRTSKWITDHIEIHAGYQLIEDGRRAAVVVVVRCCFLISNCMEQSWQILIVKCLKD